MSQTQLKAVNKQKIYLERQVFKLRNAERSICEELYFTTAEVNTLTEQLEDMKDKISETTYQISKVEIEKVAENNKIKSYVNYLNDHKKQFDSIFAEERNRSEMRNKELQQKEAEEQELERQKQKEVDKQNELQAQQSFVIEEECSAIERECSVLKKRNNAIMLKLRRKLIETEDTRRELISMKGGLDLNSITDTQQT